MSDHGSFVSANQFHPDPYAQSRIAERSLNAAIVRADIKRSYEEYLELFDEFYADDIETSESSPGPQFLAGSYGINCRGGVTTRRDSF